MRDACQNELLSTSFTYVHCLTLSDCVIGLCVEFFYYKIKFSHIFSAVVFSLNIDNLCVRFVNNLIDLETKIMFRSHESL